MNIASNPWSFVPTDVLSTAIAASPNGLILQADGSVLLTTSGVHGLAAGNNITVFNPTNLAYQGYYHVRTVPTTATANIVPGGIAITVGTAASGGGFAALNQYPHNTRIEDISWQNAAALGQILIVVDRNGLPIWEATAPGPGNQNRGKVFWVSGLTLVEMDGGILLVTVN